MRNARVLERMLDKTAKLLLVVVIKFTPAVTEAATAVDTFAKDKVNLSPLGVLFASGADDAFRTRNVNEVGKVNA